MKVTNIILALMIIILSGCASSDGQSNQGPSDQQIEDMITESFEGNSTVECINPEVKFFKITKRATEKVGDTTRYYVQVESELDCERKGFFSGADRPVDKEYYFYTDKYGEWKFGSTSTHLYR